MKKCSTEKQFARGNQTNVFYDERINERSRLRNRFLKNSSLENRMLYTHQRNYFVSPLRKGIEKKFLI